MTATEKMKVKIKEQFSSVKEFAQAANIPYTTVHTILKRGLENSSVDNVIKMANTLGTSVDELLSNESSEETPEESIETIAAHAIQDLSEEEIEEVLNFARYIKSKHKDHRD